MTTTVPANTDSGSMPMSQWPFDVPLDNYNIPNPTVDIHTIDDTGVHVTSQCGMASAQNTSPPHPQHPVHVLLDQVCRRCLQTLPLDNTTCHMLQHTTRVLDIVGRTLQRSCTTERDYTLPPHIRQLPDDIPGLFGAFPTLRWLRTTPTDTMPANVQQLHNNLIHQTTCWLQTQTDRLHINHTHQTIRDAFGLAAPVHTGSHAIKRWADNHADLPDDNLRLNLSLAALPMLAEATTLNQVDQQLYNLCREWLPTDTAADRVHRDWTQAAYGLLNQDDQVLAVRNPAVEPSIGRLLGWATVHQLTSATMIVRMPAPTVASWQSSHDDSAVAPLPTLPDHLNLDEVLNTANRCLEPNSSHAGPLPDGQTLVGLLTATTTALTS